jgi:preprotein translocase subunit SecD
VIEGFKRAWTSIRDSNISSLITCLILYWIGSSVVKGFALTLFIGVVTSMFSAITVTRTLMKFIMGNWLKEKTWLFGVKKIIKN